MHCARDYAGVAIGLVLQVVMTCSTDLDDVCYYGNSDKLPAIIRLFCDQLRGLQNRVETEVTVPQISAEELQDSFSRDTRAGPYARPGMFYGMRIQRGGNYIRFGRSYGGRSERGDGHYVRFGRSAEDSRTNIVKRSAEMPPLNSAFGVDKKFMRFGRKSRNNQDARKRFMRFGKRPDSDKFVEGLTADKKFMRFGKRDGGSGKSYDGGTQFMRFGKRADYGGTDSTVSNEVPEKRFMYPQHKYPNIYFSRPYLNKRPSMSLSDDLLANENLGEDEEERLAIFDANQDADTDKRSDGSSDTDESDEKRFMRFGRTGSMHNFPMNGEKRFMRFGKRADTTAVDDVDPNKRFMRFGKRADAEDDEDVEGAGVRVRRSADTTWTNDTTANQNGGSNRQHVTNGDDAAYGLTNQELASVYGGIPVLRLPSTEQRQNNDAENELEHIYDSIPLLSFATNGKEQNSNGIINANPTSVQGNQLLSSGAYVLPAGAYAPQQSAHAPRSDRQVMRMQFEKSADRLPDSIDSNLKTSFDSLNKLQRHFEAPAKRQYEILEPVHFHSS